VKQAISADWFVKLPNTKKIYEGNFEMASKKALFGIMCSALFFLRPTAAYADDFYVFVSVNCDQSRAKLLISFDGVWNEKGAAMKAAHKKNRWYTWDLVEMKEEGDGKYSIQEKAILTGCQLKGKKYTIEITPLMAPGYRPEGYCAARMGANVVIYLAGEKVAKSGNDGCSEVGMVLKSILITPDKKPVYKNIPNSTFYGQ
jgi:hypothetical protein